MKTKPRENAEINEPTAAEVAAYLTKHPDFFAGRDSLLLSLDLPQAHSTNNGEAISLVEHQVALLRQRSRDTRGQLDELLLSAKRNNEIYVKCQRLILGLIEAKDPNSFFKALETSFQREFKTDAYSLIIFSEYAQQVNHFTSSIPLAAAEEFVGGLIKSKEPFLGNLRGTEQDFLFRHLSDKVQSAAVIPVRNHRHMAILAIGNGDANYFRSGMGTLFISFIADVLARLLPRYFYLDSK